MNEMKAAHKADGEDEEFYPLLLVQVDLGVEKLVVVVVFVLPLLDDRTEIRGEADEA